MEFGESARQERDDDAAGQPVGASGSADTEGAGGTGPVFHFDEDDDEALYFEKLFAFKKAQDDKKQEAVRVALNKFNAFLHLTAYLAGVAYLLLLGILYRSALPYVFIPIGLWTAGIAYHFYRAFTSERRPPKKRAGRSRGSGSARGEGAGGSGGAIVEEPGGSGGESGGPAVGA